MKMIKFLILMQEKDCCLIDNFMKKILFLINLILLLSCSNNPVEKPKKMLSKQTMIDIHYDLALLQAAESNFSNKLTTNDIKLTNFIYKKYNIDSITFYANEKYYAADTRKYKQIHKAVLERLDQEKAKIIPREKLPK